MVTESKWDHWSELFHFETKSKSPANGPNPPAGPLCFDVDKFALIVEIENPFMFIT